MSPAVKEPYSKRLSPAHLAPAPQSCSKALGLVLGGLSRGLSTDGSLLGSMRHILLGFLQVTSDRDHIPGCVACSRAVCQRHKALFAEVPSPDYPRLACAPTWTCVIVVCLKKQNSINAQWHMACQAKSQVPMCQASHLAAAKQACQPAASLLLALLHSGVSVDGCLPGALLQVSHTISNTLTHISSCTQQPSQKAACHGCYILSLARAGPSWVEAVVVNTHCLSGLSPWLRTCLRHQP